MTAAQIPEVELNDGGRIPQLGLGVLGIASRESEQIVRAALDLGYRHIDTASVYGNETEVGRAIAASGLAREELFVTAKLWNSDHSDPGGALERSLDRLGLERIDLYLIHWPLPARGTAPGAWRGLIALADAGRVGSIGVSNFEIEHLRELIERTGVVPAVNQIELHPLHQRRALRDYCAAQGIAVQAWSPLSRGRDELMARDAVRAAASSHRKSPVQVLLRWHLQQGTILFPKTSRRERLAENLDVFDFSLSDAEMAAIDALDEGRGFGPDPRTFDAG
ncbi:aldo/keto reductase [Leucobacter weissii]|uniref:Aldo/keto reductase n=1 Tax=Leucobacter weissii TaxID=1983706 RepID=A0A939MMS5_9MICO|nr:aldo/keto reductase [Leucobacter weissii]MBO1901326.1 aldo/keto reductase [Leucobacter weissii]